MTATGSKTPNDIDDAALAAAAYLCSAVTGATAPPLHVEGMNCIGPTARSQTLSPSKSPLSVSEIAATGPLPLRGTPTMAGRGTP